MTESPGDSDTDTNATGWPVPYAEGAPSPWVTQLLMTLPLAMAVIDRNGDIVNANDAMLATAGPDCRPGTRPESLVVEDDVPVLRDALARAVTKGQPGEIRVAMANRRDEKQLLTITPVPPGFGIVALLAMRDIREQLRLEAQVAAATRMQAVGQLAGGVAHDFNNILTAMLTITEQLLFAHPPGDPDFEDLDQIRRNARRAAALVEQLLAFARQQPRRQQLLDLTALIEGLHPLIAQLLGDRIAISIDTGGLAHAVRADAGQVEQIIVNLAVNARDAMGGTGELGIAITDVPAAEIGALGHAIIPESDHVGIHVADTGSGIPAAIAGKIFEPFFTTKPMGQGTGLGLSTVYGIVKQSGGYIFARPRDGVPARGGDGLDDGKGTVFSIYLPAVPLHGGVMPRFEAPPAPLLPPKTSGLKVLLVEDDTAVRQILARGLQRAGHDVSSAADASEAEAMMLGGLPVDVLVSDVMMPGVDGVELVARARAQRPGLAAVLMSGFAEVPLHRAADAQGERFLAKPFALADLLAAIAAAYQGKG